MHPEDLQRKIRCTAREISRLRLRGKGSSRECQRLEELLEYLNQEKQKHG